MWLNELDLRLSLHIKKSVGINLNGHELHKTSLPFSLFLTPSIWKPNFETDFD